MQVRPSLRWNWFRLFSAVLLAASVLSWNAQAQSCQTSSDLDEATRSAITSSAQRFFDMAAKGDTASMRQGAAASLASDFSGVETAINDHAKGLSDAKATVKNVFLLTVEGAGPLEHGEFYCGVFGKNGQTATSAVFSLDGLQPGKYAVALIVAASAKGQSNFSVILEKQGNDWKLGGLYITPGAVGGHDVDWYLNQAREYKKNGQLHNAWFYFVEARELASPLSFMATAATDRLYDEMQGAVPTDVPASGKPTDLAAGGTTYKLTALFPQAVGDDLDLVVKYQVPDASNTNQAYQSNMAVISALVAKLPEIRGAFSGIVARAVDANGRDYGTLMAMKEIK